MFLIAVAVFFVVEGLILFSVIRYHRKPGDDTLPPQTHGNNIAEAVWMIVPTIIVAFLFIISWQTLNVVDAVSATPETRIVAHAGQFQWSFDYLADDGETVLFSQLAPIGDDGGMSEVTGRHDPVVADRQRQRRDPRLLRPAVPLQAGCRPGSGRQFDFKVDEDQAGRRSWPVRRAVRAGHSIMLFDVPAMTAADFDAWSRRRPPPRPRVRRQPLRGSGREPGRLAPLRAQHHDPRDHDHEDRLNGDHDPPSSRHDLQERAVRLGDDHRSQEDRDPGLIHVVPVLLHRRHPGARGSQRLAVPGLQFVSAQTYNELFTMHATFMIFLFVIPMLAGFGNYVVPLQIGAPDMAFPRINALSLWMLPLAGILLLAGFVTGGTAAAGWTSYAPLSQDAPLSSSGTGQDLWIVALVLIGTSSILGAINFLVTIFKMRAPGMTLFRMPIMVWTVMVTSVLVLMATPVITSALIMLFIDRNYGGGFFDPSVGGDPILYQNIFWFYSHPAVYVMVLPAMGMISEILPVFSRKPLFGYKAFVFATAAIGALGFSVWAHHMFTTGAVYLPFFSLDDVPHRDPDRREDVQLDLHDVGRQADVLDTDAVRGRISSLFCSVGRLAPSRHPSRLTSRSMTPTSWWRISTTCCSVDPCSGSWPASTTGSRRLPAGCSTRRWARSNSFSCSSAST